MQRRDAVVLALAAITCRLLVLSILPEGAYSIDLRHWQDVARLLHQGVNPYAATPHLNWPPLWMQIVYGLDVVARSTGLPFVDVVRWFLIVVDTLNILLAQLIAVRFLGIGRPRNLLLVGLAANPISILLVCQHANFDALVVTAMLCFVLALLRWRALQDVADWLMAALALGAGILLKTMPLVIAPLLAVRPAELTRRARLLGLTLLVLPAAVGTSIIYVLAPGAVTENVLRYRSYAGWFGVTGLLGLARLDALSRLYAAIFPLLLIVMMVLLMRYVARRAELQPRQIVLLAGVVLLALITFGPGSGSQYIAWPMPFFVLSFALFDGEWRRDLMAVWVTAIVTYVIEYAFMIGHGAFLLRLTMNPTVHYISDVLEEGPTTLLRLPLFAGYVWLTVTGARRVMETRSD